MYVRDCLDYPYILVLLIKLQCIFNVPKTFFISFKVSMLFYFLHWVNLNLSDMRNWVNKTLSNWMQLNLSLTKFQVSTSAINSFNSMNFSVFHVSGKCNLVLFPVSLSHQADRWWKTIIFFTVTSLMVDAVGHVYKQKHNALLVQNW